MRIKLLGSVAHAEQALAAGNVIDVSDEIGTAWIADGLAVAADDHPVTHEHPDAVSKAIAEASASTQAEPSAEPPASAAEPSTEEPTPAPPAAEDEQ